MRHARVGLAFCAPAVLSIAFLLAGCPSREVTSVPIGRSGEDIISIPVNVRRAVDLLFVIDNSSSMAGEQALLAENFPRLVEKLEEVPGGLPDLHLGVVSSDLGIPPFELPAVGTSGVCEGDGDGGRLLLGRPGADCGIERGVPFLYESIGKDGPERNYREGELAETFACMAALGVSGCGFEQHLEAMRRALTHPDNAGFLREDALLAVVIVADEDDCSPRDPALFDPDRVDLGPQQDFRCFEYGVVCDVDQPRAPGDKGDCGPREDSALVEPVQTYVDFLRSLKEDDGRIVVSGIVGEAGPVGVTEQETRNGPAWLLSPSCTTPDGGNADPAIRQLAFLDAFATRATAQTICPADGDLSGALSVIGQLVGQVLGSPCLTGAFRDADPRAEGIQPNCSLTEVEFLDRPSERRTAIPPCDGEADPCFRVETAPEQCRGAPHLQLVVDRSSPVPPQTTWEVRCELDL